MDDFDPKAWGCFQRPLVEVPESVRAAISQLQMRLKPGLSAAQMWEKLLTSEQRESLGRDVSAAYENFRGTAGIWLKLHRVWWPRAVIDISHGIGLLSEADFRWLDRVIREADPLASGAMDDDRQGLIEQAKNAFVLVIVDGNGNQQCFWRGQQVKQRWSRYPKVWDLILNLAAQATIGQAATWDVLIGKNPTALADRRHRLKHLLPVDLNQLIVPDESGGYRLRLPPEQIRVFQLEPEEWLLEPDSD